MLPSSYHRIEDDSSSPNGPSNNDSEPKWRSVLRRISGRAQSVDQSFVVSKLFYFFFYTALGALFPFFALFYKQLWLAAWQIGLLLALRPTVKLVCLPLWKMITDQYSKPRAVYFISIFGWLIGYYGQSFVYQSDVSCYKRTSLTRLSNVSQDTNTVSFLSRTEHALKRRNINQNLWGPFNLSPWDSLQFRKRTNKKRKEVAIVREDDEKEQVQPFFLNTHVAPKITKTQPDSSENEKLSLMSSESASHENKELERNMLKEKRKGNKRNLNFEEIDLMNDNDISFGTELHHRNKRSIEAFDQIYKRSPHPAGDFRVRYNYWIFRTLIVIVILTEIVTTPTPMLADIAIVQALVDTDSEYGKQRLFGSLGLTVAAALVAVWITQISNCPFTDTINYLPCFYVFEIAIGITVVVSLFFKFEIHREEPYELKEAMKLFKNFKNGLFLFTLFVFGFAHSVQMSFLFWFLQDIGGGPVLFAVIILVHCLAEVVTYFVSTFLVDRIGRLGLICLALACYTARFLMYSNVKDPWFVLPLEIVQGITYGGVWSVAVVYINAPAEAVSTVQSVLHGFYWGAGMALGAAVSGVVIFAAGARLWFLIVAVLCFALCLVHIVFALVSKMKGMEEKAQEDETEIEKEGTDKETEATGTSFIGTVAAPLVPCLLYAK